MQVCSKAHSERSTVPMKSLSIDDTSANDSFLTRPCPTCGGTETTDGSIASPRPAETLELCELRRFWQGFFSEKVFFTYRRCAICSLLYARAYFHDEQLGSLYAEQLANMSVVTSATLGRTAKDYLNHLRRFAPLSGTYLEIGPDTGIFAGQCKGAGKFDRMLLFEPNHAVHDALRTAVHGVDMSIEPYFQHDKVVEGSVNVATMVHVLDHVVDPIGLARLVRRTLKPDGVLFLVTHDERSLLARVLGGRWPAYCLQHPQLFNPRTMVRTLREAGYRDVRTIASTNFFPVAFLIQQLCLAAHIPEPHLPSWLSFDVGLRLGNFITVAR